jgi:hypothetical protein
MTLRRFLVFLLCFALLAAAAAGAAAKYRSYKKEKRIDALAGELTALAGIKPEMGFHEKADAVRAFIQKNSRHDINAEFKKNWRDEPKMMGLLAAHARKPGEKPPPMECSTRSAALVRMMRRLGYQAHSVAVYKLPLFKGEKDLLSHTFTEVLNPETKHWEVQDPDLNLFWRFKKDGSRAGAEDLLSHPLAEVEPCSAPDQCGYQVPQGDKAASYMNVMSIRDADNGKRPLIVNASRFDLDKPFLVKGAPVKFCDYIEKDCRQEIRIYRDAKTISP